MRQLFNQEFLAIVLVTLRVTISSTVISAILGIPLGIWLQRVNFRGKWLVININRTLMAAPPVVIGLVVYLLLMRNGPLGFIGLLFTVEAMVIAQVLLITPIICGAVYTSAEADAHNIRTFARTMGATKWQTLRLLVHELGHGIYFALVVGFGRAMSEVGAIMIVGGNIRHSTRTMTTAIMMLRNQGDFEFAIGFGIVLMAVAFVLQILAGLIRRNYVYRGEKPHDSH